MGARASHQERGEIMAVAMFLDLPGVTTGQYDQLNERMGTTKPENEPEGLLFHVCAKTASGGVLICDIWRSQGELDDFLANMLTPAAVALGLPQGGPPRFGEVHYQVNPR
jgi:hypothetical protein